MAVLYRPHRGGLEEAMKEVRAFDTVEEIIKFEEGRWSKMSPGCRAEIEEADSTMDERIGWLTKYILIRNDARNEKFVGGMCDIDTYKDCSKEEALAQTRAIFKEWRERH